jgi:hypothetical protein
MPPVSERDTPPDAATLAERLDAHGQDYALGGALALAFWALPRSTVDVDVDVTVYLPADQPSQCVWLLQDIGCEIAAAKALESLREDGFCRVTFAGLNVDVFLPIVPFYETARVRRKSVPLSGRSVLIWDAETLAVFKMMSFRRKDMADVEQILRTQGAALDRAWVRERLMEMYGPLDRRLSEWDGLALETQEQ